MFIPLLRYLAKEQAYSPETTKEIEEIQQIMNDEYLQHFQQFYQQMKCKKLGLQEMNHTSSSTSIVGGEESESSETIWGELLALLFK